MCAAIQTILVSDYMLSVTVMLLYVPFLFGRWEDSVDNNRGRGGALRGRGSTATGSRGRGGRGRGGRGLAGATTFVNATGEPVSLRCYSCGDPSHFANACPMRGAP